MRGFRVRLSAVSYELGKWANELHLLKGSTGENAGILAAGKSCNMVKREKSSHREHLWLFHHISSA